MAKVVATQRGYHGRVLREPGDVFEAEGEASWFKPVSASVQTEPSTFADDPEPTAKPAKGRGRPRAETVQAPASQPFADAPEPVRVQNEVNEITGQTEPDWVQTGGDI